jgi:hypothetical protein
MADEGAAAASLQEERGVVPPANQLPEPQNASRGRNRGSFSQKILLGGPDLWLQGTAPGLRAICNREAKVRGKVIQIPKNMKQKPPACGNCSIPVTKTRLLDSNQSGKVTAHDLTKLSQEMSEPLSLDEAKAIMSNGDWNQADFDRLMSKR